MASQLSTLYSYLHQFLFSTSKFFFLGLASIDKHLFYLHVWIKNRDSEFELEVLHGNLYSVFQ
jgi:hypothetical protein